MRSISYRLVCTQSTYLFNHQKSSITSDTKARHKILNLALIITSFGKIERAGDGSRIIVQETKIIAITISWQKTSNVASINLPRFTPAIIVVVVATVVVARARMLDRLYGVSRDLPDTLAPQCFRIASFRPS